MAIKPEEMKINKEWCKGCMLCINICPHAALELAENVNKKGQRYVVLKYPEKCTGCGLCAIMCPDCAIEITDGEK
jgi:2-oxoglutarate ferredoxin oxidoreductase subunit delta